ncbi:MAG: DUF3106 domain-containing protein [Acidobacteria bacterium]|nr:DUF3106 domain-containing protein [Acidobacteriota bacterium]
MPSTARLKSCPYETLTHFDTDDEISSAVFSEDSLVPVLFQRDRDRRRGPGLGPRPGMRRMPPPGFPRRDRGPRDAPPSDAGPRGSRPPLPPPLMDKLKDLPPEEQENVIRNNERFQQLPKEQQDRILRRWHRFQALPPEQKEMIRKRREAFERLTPEQRQKVRELFPRWRDLPDERRRALQDEFRKMREMSPEERDEYLSSKDVENRFSSEERELLKDLNSLGPPPPLAGRGRRFGPPPGPAPFGSPADPEQAQPKP